MNIITYMFVVILLYIICTATVTLFAKTSRQEVIGITVVNVVFTLLVASMFFVVSNVDQFVTSFFKLITI